MVFQGRIKRFAAVDFCCYNVSKNALGAYAPGANRNCASIALCGGALNLKGKVGVPLSVEGV